MSNLHLQLVKQTTLSNFYYTYIVNNVIQEERVESTKDYCILNVEILILINASIVDE